MHSLVELEKLQHELLSLPQYHARAECVFDCTAWKYAESSFGTKRFIVDDHGWVILLRRLGQLR
jgi:hypothetical protein